MKIQIFNLKEKELCTKKKNKRGKEWKSINWKSHYWLHITFHAIFRENYCLILFFTKHKVKWLYLYDWFTTAIGDCLCPCDFVTVPKYTNVSDVRLIQEIEKMQKELVVLKNQTSAALRKKICIKDFRPSTNASGAVWVVFLIVLAGLIIIPDMLKAIRYILLNFFQNGHSYHRRFHKS